MAGRSGTGFFLDTLVLPTEPSTVSFPTELSRTLGDPLRRGPPWPRMLIPLWPFPARAVADVADLLLSRTDLPIRRFSVLLLASDGLRVADLLDAAIGGVLPVIEVKMRDVRPEEWPNVEISELAAGCLAPVGVVGRVVPIESPMPDRDVPRLELERRLELAAGCLATVETDGLSILTELLAPGCEPGAGLSIRIERPIRVVPPESIRKLELVIDPLLGEETDELLTEIELPMRVLLLGEETDGLLAVIELPISDLLLGAADELLVVIELPIRALSLGLIRMVELLLIDVEPVELLPMEMLDEDLPSSEESKGRGNVIRLDCDRPALVLEDIVAERLGVDPVTDIRLELPKLGLERLDEIEMDRLGVGRSTDIRLGPLPLGIERPEEIETERLGIGRLGLLLGLGALLIDDLVEMLGLGAGRLMLRLEETERDWLGVGARVGAGARLGAGGWLG